MRSTVAIFNAGMGEMAYAFEKSGFEIIAVFEEDAKAVGICKKNLNENIFQCSLLELDPEEIPDADVLAGHIVQRRSSRVQMGENYNSELDKYCEIVRCKKPLVFLMVVNASMLASKNFEYFLHTMSENEYKVMYQKIDVRQVTGFPVNERFCYVVGVKESIKKEYRLLADKVEYLLDMEEFCKNGEVDEWYYKVQTERINSAGKQNSFLCWNGEEYLDKKFVAWNTMKVPLVRTNGTMRKMTHQEIAYLKGFPYYFQFQDKNNAWLYKKLMYSSNVLVLQQVAKSIMYLINEYSVRDSQIVNALKFEELYDEYLYRKTGKSFKETSASNLGVDFVCDKDGIKFNMELKFYNSNIGINQKVIRSCKSLIEKKRESFEIYVLVVANIISDIVKKECKEKFDVIIWDVRNILWLFEEYTDIRNDFISILNYTINNLTFEKPEIPISSNDQSNIPLCFEQETDEGVEENSQISSEKENGYELKKKLTEIKPGKETFSQYENMCIEILKYVLADYLTLWEEQELSNMELYRFDLCCKIKNGTHQDFFDTIINHFNTKYIIFEFKNYQDKITQKEIYTTEKYLYEKALRRVAILISRKGPDENALKAVKGCLRENGKLIICLSDNDLVNLIDTKDRGERTTAEYLGDILDDLLIHLEK